MDDALVFVDDTGFDKIFEFNKYLMLFAGTAKLIQVWKNHISDLNSTGLPPTVLDGMSIAVSITDLETSAVFFEHNQAATYETVRFAGSGASAAERCWFKNFCAKRAVGTASFFDVCTGGQVKYYSFDGNHNVDVSTTVEVIPDALRKNGVIMYRNRSDLTMPVSEAARTDPRVVKLIDDLACGKESLCAPFPHMHNPMSVSETRALEKALAKIKKPR